MLQDDGPGRAGIGSAKSCEPNYEDMAAGLKKKIDADKAGLDGLTQLLTAGSGRYIHGEKEVFALAIIGELTIIIPRNEDEYKALLEEIEKKK
jgi:hypothetical protein